MFCSPWWHDVADQIGIPHDAPPASLTYPPELDAIVDDALGRSSGAGVAGETLPLSDVVFSLGLARFNLGQETASEAYDRVTAEVDRRLRAELRKAEAEAQECGLSLAKVKRSGLDHFYWLAHYQVGGESYAAVAKRACRGRQTVKDGVREMASAIGLPLRPPDPPGRPTKRPRLEKSTG